MYLSVNADNARAIRLYERLGWSVACTRAPQMSLLTAALPTGLPPDVAVQQLPPDAAALSLAAAHCGRDCALTAGGFSLLTTHPAYETSFSCCSPSCASSASLHLWNGSLLGGFEVSRVIVPTLWLESTFFLAAAAAAAAGLLSLATLWLQQQALARKHGPFIAGAAALALLLLAARSAAPSVLLTRRMLVSSNYPERRKRVRVRLFGLSCEGPRGPALLAGLVQHAKNEARRRGFVLCAINLAEDDPLRLAVGKPSFRTVFMQKSLGVDSGAPPPPFDPAGFHDPRDMS